MADPAAAFLARPGVFAQIGAVSSPPRGWTKFCNEHPGDCRPSGELTDEITLTPKRLEQLYSINHFANDRVSWTSDVALYGVAERWDYPLDRGDCEDIVLLKRKLLIKEGWPASVLLITEVKNPRIRDRHAVLAVRTNAGELILDNLTPEILFWNETPYQLIRRQSTKDPNVWVSLPGKLLPRVPPAAGP
ncbi:MAG: transglutaminase-like cysteine peptidase [Blastochloris sp.]|nr:transglutaminase-like cysteine peptidase [Blastochloris sp.]